MSELPHLRLEGTETAENYVYPGIVVPGTFDRPKRNQLVHAKKVREELRGIAPAIRQRREEDREAHPELIDHRADGVVLTFRSDADSELSLDRLDRDSAAIELIGVKTVGQVQIARVLVPHGRVAPFLKLLDAYAGSVVLTYIAEPKHRAKLEDFDDPDNGIKLRKPVRVTKQEKVKVTFIVVEGEVPAFKRKVGTLATLDSETRQNAEFIDSIASVRLAVVEDFWQDRHPFPEAGRPIWWEVWLLGTRAEAAEIHRHFVEIAEIVGMERVSDVYVGFPERVVVHALATAEQLSAIDLLAMIGELRKGKELATGYADLSGADQAAFVADAAARLVLPPGDDPPCVCILDTGVNRPHPLIKPALDREDQHAAKLEWGVSDHDSRQHGTGMAGNALYGCLTEIMQTTGKIHLRHILESAKILPPPPGKNEPPDYGRRMQDGVALAHIQAPQRKRVLCMAVTTDEYLHGGIPSLWSGAADDLCSGGYDGARRLMFISAGNMRDEICEDNYVYHDWNTTRGGVEDPGQAWNALTVGAYTEKVAITHRSLKGWSPVAESGALCPTSRTSLAWPTKVQKGWPIKPDLVMEGGNYARKDKAPMSCDDLSLLTTYMGNGRLLTTTRDTSPATALAARMAAIIWSHHPRFWPETVRALIVHSASWKPAMINRFPGNTKSVILRCLRCYGYGVPDLQRALHSANNAVTMIYEGDLRPFRKEKSEIKTNHMNLHELPWPIEVLEELGNEQVTMRVTLSYFVDPSPGGVSWVVNGRYASHGLRFDVIRPTEGVEGFKKRMSRAFWDSSMEFPRSARESRHWVVGEDNRTLGSLHSDWWRGTAAELARSGHIVVYPVSGWWKDRKHLKQHDQPARYSLLVSIESRKTSIDLYTPIVNVGAIQTEVID